MSAAVAEAKARGSRRSCISELAGCQGGFVEAGARCYPIDMTTDIPDELAKKMAAKGVWEIPTMVYQTEFCTSWKIRGS